MKLTIESTDIVAVVNGRPSRLWFGRSEKGVECQVYVACITVDADVGYDVSEFAELQESGVPMELAATVGMRRDN